jgi:hypothetical protein
VIDVLADQQVGRHGDHQTGARDQPQAQAPAVCSPGDVAIMKLVEGK